MAISQKDLDAIEKVYYSFIEYVTTGNSPDHVIVDMRGKAVDKNFYQEACVMMCRRSNENKEVTLLYTDANGRAVELRFFKDNASDGVIMSWNSQQWLFDKNYSKRSYEKTF